MNVDGNSIDELLDRAVAAINRGDRDTATALAGQVLAADASNAEAEDLLFAPGGAGEIRRLTIFFADLVDSTALSTRVEPETYRLLVGRYREFVQRAVDRYEGHIGSTKGDGVLAVFGHPIAHEDDVRRAVHAGLEITREVSRLSEQARRRFGIQISVRVGVHRGLVYLDTVQDDVYGLAANLAARVSSLAPPGAVVVSDAVELLIRGHFDLRECPRAAVKGVEQPIAHYQVMSERLSIPRLSRGPLVGRNRERARLEEAWARAQSGTSSTPGVVFRGEPGIGKSRLVALATELATASRAMVLELTGSPFHTDAGLHPVRTMLERRCGIDRGTDQHERLRLLETEVGARGLDPVGAVPLLAPVLGIDAKTGYQPVAAEGRKLYELIARAVKDYVLACLDCSALVVAEDVHWFDPSTREVLGALLDAADGRLLVVITGRPGDWLPGSWPATVFDLVPLTDEQTDTLISALNPDLAEDERRAVAARCDGVPFYIEQIVGGLGATGVPETLYEPLFARLRASPAVVPIVEAAAVIGRHIERGLLGTVVELSDDEIDTVIDELEDALVLEKWGSDGWRFRHELLREVAAEIAPPTVSRDLHAKVADALMDAGEPEWGLVAAHYEAAQRFDQSALAYLWASTAALLRGGLAEAREYLTRGLTQLDRATPSPDRDRMEMALRLDRGRLTRAVEGYHSRDAAADYERCLQLAGTDLHDDELFATLAALSGYYVTRADLQRAAQVNDALRAGLDRRRWFSPVVEANVGLVAFLHGEFDAAIDSLEAATTELTAAEQHTIGAEWFRVDEPLAYAHTHLAWARLIHGDLTAAQSDLVLAARRADNLGFPLGPYITGYARGVETGVCVEVGRLHRAAELAGELSAHAERNGLDLFQLVGATWQSVVDGLATFDTDDADQHSAEAQISTVTALLDSSRNAGLNLFLTFYDGVLGRLLIAAGQPETGRARIDMALALARDTGMCFYDAELLRLRAQTHEDPAARRADLDAALELSRRQGAHLFELRAALDDFELRGEHARGSLVEALERLPADSSFPEVARARNAL